MYSLWNRFIRRKLPTCFGHLFWTSWGRCCNIWYVTKILQPMYKYKILSFKYIVWNILKYKIEIIFFNFKYMVWNILKYKIQIKLSVQIILCLFYILTHFKPYIQLYIQNLILYICALVVRSLYYILRYTISLEMATEVAETCRRFSTFVINSYILNALFGFIVLLS